MRTLIRTILVQPQLSFLYRPAQSQHAGLQELGRPGRRLSALWEPDRLSRAKQVGEQTFLPI